MFRRSRPPLLLAAASLVALVVTGVLGLLVPAAHVRDVQVLEGFMELERPRTEGFLETVAHLGDPLPYACIGLTLAIIAFARGRRRLAMAIPVVLVASGATTQILKVALASPRVNWVIPAPDGVTISDHAWPSGHATAAMTLALCAVMAVPGRLRPAAAAVGGAFAIGVSFSILAGAWHFPSDVLGGFFVAALWAMLALSALAALEWRSPEPARVLERPRMADALPGLAVAIPGGLLALIALAVRPHVLEAHTTFVAGAIVIAASALVLASLLAGSLRGSRTTVV
jgi:membrane-associated phospholipid phosphatase